VPLVLPHRQSLSICPISITFVTLIMGIHDVILKTEVYNILHCHHMTEDRAKATGKGQKILQSHIIFKIYEQTDTQTHRQTDMLIAILCTSKGV